ncbi:hypothetical protein [Microbacterium sp. NPDC055455]
MTTTSTPAESFVQKVNAFLDEEDRTPAWLARRAGIPYNTLRRQLDQPNVLPFNRAVTLSEVTGIIPEPFGGES